MDRVQRVIGPYKVGHAGTLDPMATGVLVIAVGSATRLTPYVQRMKKQYLATFLLGQRSDTDDCLGQVEMLANPPKPSRLELERVLPEFVGLQQQTPPRYSAVKLRGRPAYELARRGAVVELAAKPITIYELQIVSYAYPELVVNVTCGSGTYIRSLGRDLAARWNTCAVTAALTRLAIGPFLLEQAILVRDLDKDTIAAHLLSPLMALEGMTIMELNDAQIARIGHGLAIDSRLAQEAEEVAAVDCHGRLMALLQPRGEGMLGPVRNFVACY